MTWVNDLHALNFYLIQQLINAKNIEGKVDHIAFFQETLTGENTERNSFSFIHYFSTYLSRLIYKYIAQDIHTCSMESGHMYIS